MFATREGLHRHGRRAAAYSGAMGNDAGTGRRTAAVDDHTKAFVGAREALHKALAIDADTGEVAWMQGIQQAIQSLGGLLKVHQGESEKAGGLLREITSTKPALVGEVDRLEREHIEMLHRSNAIEQEIERQLAFEEYKVELVRMEAEVLHAILHLHLLRTDWLLYEVYFRDEGGEEG